MGNLRCLEGIVVGEGEAIEKLLQVNESKGVGEVVCFKGQKRT